MKNIIPKSITRFAYRSALKTKAASPTIMVVAGVVGFGATAVMAARATRKIDPVIEKHQKSRWEIEQTVYQTDRAKSQHLVKLYSTTTYDLARVYFPTICVGAMSAASILYGHNVLKGRHLATLAAYSGLAEEFKAYRERVSQTLGEEAERDIYDGARGDWEEDPAHPGEMKRVPVFDNAADSYLRPWFDETNRNWTRDSNYNYLFLKGVQQHMNNLLQIRGHVFLNDVFDALGMDRCKEAAVAGWVLNGEGDNYVDFGFMASNDPNTIAFRNGGEKSVRLNFNIDGVIWDLIS